MKFWGEMQCRVLFFEEIILKKNYLMVKKLTTKFFEQSSKQINLQKLTI